MPLYEYQCQQCGRRNEVLQKMADPPLTVCEVCGGPLKKLASSPSVQFKGSGWYVTDYARKGGGGTAAKGESGGESKGEAAKGEGGSGGAGESKPAASGGASAGSSGGASSTPSASSSTSSGSTGGGE